MRVQKHGVVDVVDQREVLQDALEVQICLEYVMSEDGTKP